MAETAGTQKTAAKKPARKKTAAKRKTARVKRVSKPMEGKGKTVASAAIATFVDGIMSELDGEAVRVSLLSGNRIGMSARAKVKSGKTITLTISERG